MEKYWNSSRIECKVFFLGLKLLSLRATAPSGPGLPHDRGFTITLGHTTLGRTPQEQVMSSRQRALPDHKQHSQQTGIHAPGGIRTYDPNRQVATDPRLRLRGHWDQSGPKLLKLKIVYITNLLSGRLIEPNEIFYQNVSLVLI